MQHADTICGALLAALGCALIVTGATFPDGAGGLPGAGFFPQAIGALMTLLASALLLRGLRRRSEGPFSIANMREVAVAAALLLAYLLLWGSGWFVVRTAVFLAIMLSLLGQRWKPALGFASALAILVYLAFDAGLNVTLE